MNTIMINMNVMISCEILCTHLLTKYCKYAIIIIIIIVIIIIIIIITIIIIVVLIIVTIVPISGRSRGATNISTGKSVSASDSLHSVHILQDKIR